MTRSALEVVTLYNLEIWNKGRVELVPELCADPMIRYDANSVTAVGIDEQIARIKHNYDELRPTFEPIVLAGDDEFITLVWNVTGRDPNWKWCGIEVFHVVDGKIVEVWNGPYVDGRWVRGGTLELGAPGGPLRSVPVNSAALEDGSARITVPLDDSAIDIWLGTIFGPPTLSDQGREARFTWTDQADRLDIAFTESGKASVMLGNAAADSLEIRWARSGLTNVTIGLSGIATTAARPVTSEPVQAMRLAECFGRFTASGANSAHVAGASIELDRRSRKASGEVTLRMSKHMDPNALCSAGALAFGWRSGPAEIRFDMAEARLLQPEGAFTDGDEIEALYRWTADDVAVTRPRAFAERDQRKSI